MVETAGGTRRPHAHEALRCRPRPGYPCPTTSRSRPGCGRRPSFCRRNVPIRFAWVPTAGPPTAWRSAPTACTTFRDARHRGLDALPGVGPGIAAAIAEMLQTGRWAQLERLRGTLDPALLFRTVPGIGPEFAQRIHDALNVETLEALEAAAHDGRLETVPGVGARRTATIRAALAEILDRSRLRTRPPPGAGASLRSRCCSTSTASTATARARGPAHDRAAPLQPGHARGCPYCTRCAAAGISPRCSRTRRRRTTSGARRTGSSSISTTTTARENQRTVVTETHGTLVGRRVVRGGRGVPRALRARRIGRAHRVILTTVNESSGRKCMIQAQGEFILEGRRSRRCMRHNHREIASRRVA